MAYVSSCFLPWGMVCSVFALVFAQDGVWDCGDRDDFLREVPADVRMPSDCTLDCTARTYRAVLAMQTRTTIRFTDSRVGEHEEYCWSTRRQCSSGQRLQSAFVLVPVDSSVMARETIRLQINSEINGATLHHHAEDSVIAPECGLRFDVTEHIAAKERQENLCVKIMAQDQGLMCPPYLVTMWEKWNQG
ncbi:uncharacterized protein Hap1MRO34_021206 [Clarias gariepinus]